MPELVKPLVDWLQQHPWLAWTAFGFSLTTALAAIVIVPWVIVRIPADYFAHNRPPETRWQKAHPALRVILTIGMNALGLLLLVAGFVMLFTPGQGVITMLVGLALMNIPGKRTLERWIATRPPVFSALNKLRAKYNHPPLEHPQRD